MAEGRRTQAWRIAATLAVTIGNGFRTSKNMLKFSDFPYCRDLKAPRRMATAAECRAFVQAWGGK